MLSPEVLPESKPVILMHFVVGNKRVESSRVQSRDLEDVPSVASIG